VIKRRPLSPRVAVLVGAATTVVVMLPVFLTGAMAVELSGELAFGAVGLGVAVGAYRATSAVSGLYLGRLADRLGALPAARIAASIAAVSSMGIALTASNWVTLVAWLSVGSWTNALGQPAANRLLVHRVRPEWRGRAFGIKQSAAPLAAMLSGAFVPLVALTVGWRWAYAIGAGLALLVIVGTWSLDDVGERGGVARAPREPLAHRGILVALGLAFCLGVAASVSIPTFYVAAAVSVGTPQAIAGWVLAGSAVAAIIVRLTAGAAVDKLALEPLLLCATLILGGAVALLLLAGGRPLHMAVGAIASQALGWGWNGVFWYSVMRMYPATPGTITGVLAPGGLIGGTLGPVVFGAITGSAGYSVAWVAMAAAGMASGIVMVAVARASGRVLAPRTSPV
jgi:MFS family permease